MSEAKHLDSIAVAFALTRFRFSLPYRTAALALLELVARREARHDNDSMGGFSTLITIILYTRNINYANGEYYNTKSSGIMIFGYMYCIAPVLYSTCTV